MRTHWLVLGTFFLARNCSPRQAQIKKRPPALSNREAPAKYRRVVEFLHLLGASQRRREGEAFGARKIAFPNVDHLVSFVSARGLTIVDVGENGGRPLELSRERLRRDLKRTGSSAFDSFAYAGYLAASPSALDAKLRFQATRKGVVVRVQTSHRLTWVREGRRLQLCKVEAFRFVGD